MCRGAGVITQLSCMRRRVRIRMRRPNKIAIQSSYMHERDAWLYKADLKWNHRAIAEEGGWMPNPPTGDWFRDRSHNTEEDHLKID